MPERSSSSSQPAGQVQTKASSSARNRPGKDGPFPYLRCLTGVGQVMVVRRAAAPADGVTAFAVPAEGEVGLGAVEAVLVTPPPLGGVHRVEVGGEPAAAEVADPVGCHGTDLLAVAVEQCQPEAGKTGRPSEITGGQVPSSALGLGHRGLGQTAPVGEFPLRQIGSASDPAECSGQIEGRHSISLPPQVASVRAQRRDVEKAAPCGRRTANAAGDARDVRL